MVGLVPSTTTSCLWVFGTNCSGPGCSVKPIYHYNRRYYDPCKSNSSVQLPNEFDLPRENPRISGYFWRDEFCIDVDKKTLIDILDLDFAVAANVSEEYANFGADGVMGFGFPNLFTSCPANPFARLDRNLYPAFSITFNDTLGFLYIGVFDRVHCWLKGTIWVQTNGMKWEINSWRFAYNNYVDNASMRFIPEPSNPFVEIPKKYLDVVVTSLHAKESANGMYFVDCDTVPLNQRILFTITNHGVIGVPVKHLLDKLNDGSCLLLLKESAQPGTVIAGIPLHQTYCVTYDAKALLIGFSRPILG